MTQKQNESARIVVLAAIDCSAAADDVVRTSATLAQTRSGAELHLLHVVEPPPGLDGHAGVMTNVTDLCASANGQIEAATARARGHFSGPLVAHLAAGAPVREVLELAETLEADLIVVGSRRKTTAERWFLGSVSEQVVRKASCAVLVAKPKDYLAVPSVEPVCAECVALKNQTGNDGMWCGKHDRSRRHPRGHVHYEVPASFAVGSLLLRPEG